MPCLGKRVRREAAFGKGQGQAECCFASYSLADRSGIFRGGEFARKSRGADGARSSVGVRTVEKKDDVARVAEGHFKHAGNVVENAEHADDGSGIDRFAEGFVVEADVASGDGRAESQRSFGYAVDHLRKLPHDFGLFRAAEVEAVRGGERTRAARGNVARGFRDGMHRAEVWIELAPAAVAIGRERESTLDLIGFRIFDAHHGGITGARPGKRIRAHRGVILLGDPALGSKRGRSEQPQDRKSTRLNSSHGYISYAVFCLKKKKKTAT